MTFKHCKDCTERHINCHSDCELYLVDKTEYDRIKALGYKDKVTNTYYTQRNSKLISDIAKRRRKHDGVAKFKAK